MNRAALLPTLLTGLLLVGSAPSAGAAVAPDEMTSRLAPAVLRGAAEVPELWLAQRSIEREWGPSEDSLYRTLSMPGWKYEGLALGLSAAVPGAGQLYVGEGSGWLFMAAEALGWAGRVITRHRGDELRDQAAALVGDPLQSGSNWSFERYTTTTGADPEELRRLWAQDRDAFYTLLANDSDYRFGFAGTDPTAAYDTYRGIHDSSQDRYRQSRYAEVALWLNHAVAAFDALRAARFHNLPLRRQIELQLSGRVRPRGGELRAALVRRF